MAARATQTAGNAGFTAFAAWALAAGMLLVPLLIGLAMATFPDGHYGVAHGYSFSRHVVSDLGRTRLSNGAPNPVSCALFAAAMVLAGGISGLFWWARQSFVRHPLLRRTALLSGLCASLCLALIGLTPLDRAGAVHDPITAATAVSAALAILMLFADADTRFESQRAKRGWFVTLVAVSAVWTALVALHHEHLLAFRPWLPLGQKTLIVSFVGWLLFQNMRLFKICRSVKLESL